MSLTWIEKAGRAGEEPWVEASVGGPGFGLWLVARPSRWQIDIMGSGRSLVSGTASSLEDAQASALDMARRYVATMSQQLA